MRCEKNFIDRFSKVEKSQGEVYRLKARLENAQGEQESLRDEYDRAQASVARLHSERDKAIAELEKTQEELERTQATLGKAQLQQDKLQNLLDKTQSEVDKLQEKLDKTQTEIRRVRKLCCFARAKASVCHYLSEVRMEMFERFDSSMNRCKWRGKSRTTISKTCKVNWTKRSANRRGCRRRGKRFNWRWTGCRISTRRLR